MSVEKLQETNFNQIYLLPLLVYLLAMANYHTDGINSLKMDEDENTKFTWKDNHGVEFSLKYDIFNVEESILPFTRKLVELTIMSDSIDTEYQSSIGVRSVYFSTTYALLSKLYKYRSAWDSEFKSHNYNVLIQLVQLVWSVGLKHEPNKLREYKERYLSKSVALYGLDIEYDGLDLKPLKNRVFLLATSLLGRIVGEVMLLSILMDNIERNISNDSLFILETKQASTRLEIGFDKDSNIWTFRHGRDGQELKSTLITSSDGLNNQLIGMSLDIIRLIIEAKSYVPLVKTYRLLMAIHKEMNRNSSQLFHIELDSYKPTLDNFYLAVLRETNSQEEFHHAFSFNDGHFFDDKEYPFLKHHQLFTQF